MEPFHLERQSWLTNPMAAVLLPLVAITSLMVATLSWEGSTIADRLLMAAGVLVPVLLLVLAATTGLEVAVTRGSLTIHPRPMPAERVVLDDVVDTRVVDYDAADHGGWGVRRESLGRAYTVKGHRVVRLDLADGHHLLVGSRDPEYLKAALDEARR